MNLFMERTKYVAAVVLYGTIGVFLRHVSLPSEIVALWRGVIGALYIIVYQRFRHQRMDRNAIRSNLPWLIVSGICLGLNWVLLFAAYMNTTVAVASLCNYMAPIIVILIAPAVLHEPLDRRKLPCVAAALLGILLISGVWTGSIGSFSGVVMGLAAAICFVVIVICNRKIHDIPALDKSAFQLAVSALTVLPYALLHNRGVELELTATSLLIIVVLGVVHTGIAYCFYFSGMGSLPVQTVAILGYLEPAVSVLCSAVLLHEALGIAGWIGALLIIGAALVSELLTQTSRPEKTS